jgi:hypothetical protein
VVSYIVNHYCLLLQSIAQRLLHFFRWSSVKGNWRKWNRDCLNTSCVI